MTSNILFSASDLSMAIGSQRLFGGADFSVGENERVALVGRNGSGKSTLLKIIHGSLQPDSGTLSRRKELRSALLSQSFSLASNATVGENLNHSLQWIEDLITSYESISLNDPRHLLLEQQLNDLDAWHLDRWVSEVSERLHLPNAARIAGTLSGGEQRRVALAQALLSKPDLLLLDEPTNHLDIESILWIEKFLSSCRTGCVIVTHDRYFLDRVATRIVELKDGQLYDSGESYADYITSAAEREEALNQIDAKRRHFLRSEIEWARRSPKARLKRNVGRLKRFESASAEKNHEFERAIDLVVPTPRRLGNKTIELKDATLKIGNKTLFEHLDMEFPPGSKIGIVGANGAGKTTFLRLLAGELEPAAGLVVRADTVKINYIDQNRTKLDPENTVKDEISGGVETIDLGDEKVSVWGYLRRFLFDDDRINTQVKYLSGGEKARLLLAKQLKTGGNFLLLDEPTNDLDLSALRMLEEALSDFAGCVALVSHDRCFLNRICDRVLCFELDGLHITDGDFDYYEEKKLQRAVISPTPHLKSSAPVTSTAPKSRKKLNYNEQRELENIENKVMSAEDNVSKLELVFSDPDFFVKHGKDLTKLQSELEEAKLHVESLYRRWEELEAKASS